MSKKKLIRWVVVLAVLILLGVGIWFWLKAQGPIGSDLSRELAELPANHIQPGTSFSGYNSNPPTSGSHWSSPLQRGVYKDEQPDEKIVHNLEHGEIWIAYHPRLSSEVVGELEEIAGKYNKIIMTPRTKNETDVALVAWTRLDAFNLDGKELDRTRIEDFIKRWRNKGPELVP